MRKVTLLLGVIASLALSQIQCSKEKTIVEKVEIQEGSKIHYGNGAPSLDIGKIGDYYFDITYSNLYGAKSSNGWGEPISLRGEQGERGLKGEKGEQGDKGERGEQGEKGEQGDKGYRGEQGIQGMRGIQGEQGAQGQRGEKGERGEQGEQGQRG